MFSSGGGARAKPEVKRLEDKVARIAGRKCSVEEVDALYKELEGWLLAEKDEQVRFSLFLPTSVFLFVNPPPALPLPLPSKPHPIPNTY